MENLALNAKKKFTMDTFFSNVKISTEAVVSKVLSANAKSTIINTDIQNGVASLSGKLAVQVVYLTTENTIASAETVYDYVEKQKFEYNMIDSFGIDDAVIESTNATGNEVVVSVKHNAVILGTYSYEIPKEFDGEGDIVSKTTNFKVNKIVASANDNFSVSEETLISQKDVKILNVVSQVILNEVSCTVDKIVLDGKILAEVEYLSDNELVSLNKDFDFRQEIAAQGVVPNNFASAKCDVKAVTISPVENDDKTTLGFGFEVMANVCAYEEENLEICADLFSLKNELNIAYDYVDQKGFASSAFYSDSVLSQTDISEVQDFEDIVSVFNPKAKVVDVQNLGNKAVVVAEVTASAIYKTKDSYNVIDVKAEIKYELAKDVNQDILSANAGAMINSFKVKAGKELEVIFKLGYTLEFGKNENVRYVKNIEVLKEKDADFGGIRVYITRSGETIFDVAKVLNIKPETITSQNEVVDGFEQGEKIYVYSPINLI